MAWVSLKSMRWAGRQVEPGDVLFADGEKPTCHMPSRASVGLVIELKPGQRLHRDSKRQKWRIVSDDTPEPEAKVEATPELAPVVAAPPPPTIPPPEPVAEPEPVTPSPDPEPEPAKKRTKRKTRRSRPTEK